MPIDANILLRPTTPNVSNQLMAIGQGFQDRRQQEQNNDRQNHLMSMRQSEHDQNTKLNSMKMDETEKKRVFMSVLDGAQEVNRNLDANNIGGAYLSLQKRLGRLKEEGRTDTTDTEMAMALIEQGPEGIKKLRGMTDAIVKQGEQFGILKAPAQAKGTSLMQEASALFPNDPAKQRDYIQQGRMKPNSSVSVNTGDNSFKVPAGFMLNDPQNPSKGVTPIPGGPQDEQNVGDAGKTQMLRVAKSAYNSVKDLVYDDDGGVDRKNLFTANAINGGVPFTEGQELSARMEFGIQAITRLETGAAMPPQEIQNTVQRFMPKSTDSDKVIDLKLKMYDEFISGSLKLVDPSGRFEKGRFQTELLKRTRENKSSSYKEGQTATHPETGQRMILRGGKWQEL